jgi:hypothetical protein
MCRLAENDVSLAFISGRQPSTVGLGPRAAAESDGRSLPQATLADDMALVDPGKYPNQPILTDTVLHGAMTPVLSLSRQSRTEAAMPEPPVTLVVMTIEADCPGFTKPGSHEGVSELMATPFGSTHGGLPTTSALVTSVIMRSSGADSGPLLVSAKTNVSVRPV